jgi:murein DD-endopeptidase MepM/ murein hydrolase activator NlpD
MESFELKAKNDYEKLKDEFTFHDTWKLLAETILDTLWERKPWKPIETAEQVNEIMNPQSSTIHIVQLSRPDNLTSYAHTESVQSYITWTDSSVVVWDLDLTAPTTKAILQQLWTTEQYPALLVFSGGEIQATVKQSLSAQWRTNVIQWVKTNNSTLIAQGQLMKEYTGAWVTVTATSHSYDHIKVVDSKTQGTLPQQNTNQTPTTTNSAPSTINTLQQPRLTLDPVVSVTGDTERFSAQFYSDAQTFLIITWSTWSKISLPLATKYKEIYTIGKIITDTIIIGTKTYECTLTNTWWMLKVALALKKSADTEKNLTAMKPLNVAHLKLRLWWKEIKTIDKRLYSMNGSMLPDSRESVYNEKKWIFAINGIDEWLLNFDKSLLYINPYGLESGKVYQGKELKFWLPVSYKLVVGVNGVLQIHVEPALETIQKYADQWYKWPDLRPFARKPNGGKWPTMPKIPEQLQELLERFEWDPNESQEELPDAVDMTTESVEWLWLTFNGVKVNTVFVNVYWVPHALLWSIKVKYNKSKKTFQLYRDNALVDSDVCTVGLSSLEKGNSSFKTNFRFPKVTHEGMFRGEIDAWWNLRVYWWDKTWPWYESAESPLWWTLPFDANNKFVVTSWFKTPRQCADCPTWIRPHHGIDIAMPVGSPIYAVAWGKVITATERWWYGKYVMIDHWNGYVTRYAHLSSTGVAVWSIVTAWQQIGKSWNTWVKTPNSKWSTWPHLHFDVKKGAKAVDPCTIFDFRKYDKTWKFTRWVRPAPVLKSYAEGEVSYGEASFYNDSFDWKETRSGKIYRKTSNIAAHNSLPFWTIVKVTNTKTWLSTEVVIEDTWDFDKYNRAIDLSRSSMEKIGGIEEWTPYVKMQVIKLGDRKNPKSGIWWWGNSWGNNTPKTTPTPSPNAPKITPNKPNAPTASPEIALMKEPPAYVAAAVTFWWKSFTSYSPIMVWNPWASTKTAPRGWLVEVKNGTITVHTQEWIKTVAAKGTFESRWKTYTLQAKWDNSNKAYPNAARFSIVTK